MERKDESRIEKDKQGTEEDNSVAAFIIDMDAVQNFPKAKSGKIYLLLLLYK